jgi:CelD/BcsL family acetyltransferase involved in cellulose biosynthesis
MNVAVSCHPEDVSPAQLRQVRAIDKVEVFQDMAGAEPFWRRLEAGRALTTPYQRFDLLAAWQRHVGARAGLRPFIVIGFDSAGEPAFLWPFGRNELGPLAVVKFLGSKHANFNVGLWRRDIINTIGPDDIRGIFDRIVAGGHRVDLAALFSQPLSWEEFTNPLLLLPHQAAVDIGARQHLNSPADKVIADVLSASTRARLRSKERNLQKLAGYRYIQAASGADIDRLLDAFFALKATHMAAQGLTNVFGEPGVAEFLREACHKKRADGRPLIELHALEGGGEVLALFGTIADDYRFSSMFNTYTLGENSRYSPGLIMLVHLLTECVARGLRSFDMGVGRAHYKSIFCKEPEPLFDIFYPLTARGRLAAYALGAAFATKRVVKAQPALWAAIQALRRLRARRWRR